MLGFAGIILTHGNKVMMFKRALSLYKFGGYWSIPSGHREEGETPRECAIRETFEETQIVSPDSETNLVEEVDTGNGIFYVYHWHMNELQTPVLDFEHTEYGLYENIDQLTPIQPEMKKIIDGILNDIQKTNR